MRLGLTGVFLVLFAGQVLAQTVTVHLINGDNGKLVGGKNVTIRWDEDDFLNKVVVPIDKLGVGRFQVVAGKSYFSMEEGPKVGKEPNRVAYGDCSSGGDTSKIPIKTVMERGFVPGNGCSKKVSASAKPGEVVFFAKLIPWWMPDMQ